MSTQLVGGHGGQYHPGNSRLSILGNKQISFVLIHPMLYGALDNPSHSTSDWAVNVPRLN